MPISALVLAAQPIALPCQSSQLRLSLSGRDGDFNGMSHSGIELSIRNRGADCTIPAMPTIAFRDARGHALPASRRASTGMHPGPVMVPVRLAAGHRVSSDLRWVSGAVYPHSRSVRAAAVTVSLGGKMLRAPITAVLYGAVGKAVIFDQTPFVATEDMAH